MGSVVGMAKRSLNILLTTIYQYPDTTSTKNLIKLRILINLEDFHAEAFVHGKRTFKTLQFDI